MIVEALNSAGMLGLTQQALRWLAAAPDGYGKFHRRILPWGLFPMA